MLVRLRSDYSSTYKHLNSTTDAALPLTDCQNPHNDMLLPILMKIASGNQLSQIAKIKIIYGFQPYLPILQHHITSNSLCISDEHADSENSDL